MNINANAAALATKPAKPAPVGPRAEPSPAERTAQTLTHPAHRPGDKAQRMRTQAQKERPFKEHVQAQQQTAKTDLPQEVAKPDAVEGAAPTIAQAKPAPVENADKQQNSQLTQQTQGETEAEAKPAATEEQEHAKPDQYAESEPFVQDVLAQVMEVVDPALRFKVAPRASSSSVNAQASAAMRTGDAEGKQTPVPQNTQASDAASPQGSPLNPDMQQTTQSALPPVQPTGAQAVNSQRPSADALAPAADSTKPAEQQRSSHAATAVDAAARATANEGMPTTGRVTLTQGFSVAVVPSMSIAAPAGSGAQAKAPASTASTPAQQVQRAFEVAMHDLPAPAGERLVTLKMNPAALGTLRIALHVSGDTVNVRFQVGNAKARAAIDESMEDLKAAVGRQGLRIASVEVEEDRALTAPGGVQLDHDGKAVAPAAAESAPARTGKGFAQLLNAPPSPSGSEGLGADAQQAADTAGHASQGAEDGVLQVLTFRLDAVA